MLELEKLDPSFQIKKKKSRKSIETFMKNCKELPHPYMLENFKGIKILVSPDFENIAIFGNVTADILNVLSETLDTKCKLIPAIKLYTMPYFGSIILIDGYSYKIKPKEDASSIVMNKYFEKIYEKLNTPADVAIGTITFTTYKHNVWEKRKRVQGKEFETEILRKELAKTTIDNETLTIDQERVWFTKAAAHGGPVVPWRTIQVGVSDFGPKRASSHIVMWTVRKNPQSTGKPYICSIYDSNGNVSFRSTYLNKVFELLENEFVKYYVIHMPIINIGDTDVIKKAYS